ETAALVAAFAVVAEARDDPAERLGAGIEPGPAGMVLEARQRSAYAGLELAVQEDVADHPPLPGNGLEREQADARHVLAVKAPIAPTQQLVAAADGEQRCAG